MKDNYSMSFSDPKKIIYNLYYFDNTYNECYGYALMVADYSLYQSYIQDMDTRFKKQADGTWIETNKVKKSFRWMLKQKQNSFMFLVRKIE